MASTISYLKLVVLVHSSVRGLLFPFQVKGGCLAVSKPR